MDRIKGYVSRGVAILAGLMLGFPYRRFTYNPLIVEFAMKDQKRDIIKKMKERIGSSTFDKYEKQLEDLMALKRNP